MCHLKISNNFLQQNSDFSDSLYFQTLYNVPVCVIWQWNQGIGDRRENSSFLVEVLILRDFNFSFLGQEIFNETKTNSTEALTI